MEVFIDSAVACLPATDKRLAEIKTAQEEDDLCKKVTKHFLEGLPQKCDLDPGSLSCTGRTELTFTSPMAFS